MGNEEEFSEKVNRIPRRNSALDSLYKPVKPEKPDNPDKKEDANINNKQQQSKNTSKVVDKYMGRSATKPKTSNDLVGIYFDPEVKDMLATLQERFGRGFKSEFVNEAVLLHISKEFPEKVKELPEDLQLKIKSLKGEEE